MLVIPRFCQKIQMKEILIILRFCLSRHGSGELAQKVNTKLIDKIDIFSKNKNMKKMNENFGLGNNVEINIKESYSTADTSAKESLIFR